MTKVFAYTLLLIYLAALCKPVAPLVRDMLAHSFWELEHMTTVHHHHGNHHAHVELKKTSQTENEMPTNTKFGEPFSVHITAQKTISFYSTFITKKEYPYFQSTLQESITKVNIPPPKA